MLFDRLADTAMGFLSDFRDNCFFEDALNTMGTDVLLIDTSSLADVKGSVSSAELPIRLCIWAPRKSGLAIAFGGKPCVKSTLYGGPGDLDGSIFPLLDDMSDRTAGEASTVFFVVELDS